MGTYDRYDEGIEIGPWLIKGIEVRYAGIVVPEEGIPAVGRPVVRPAVGCQALY